MKRSGKAHLLVCTIAIAAGSLLTMNLLAVRAANASEPAMGQPGSDAPTTADAVVRIGGVNAMGQNVVGTGSIIGDMNSSVLIGGVLTPTIDLCIVTCNHVVAGSNAAGPGGLRYIGFGNLTAGGTVADGSVASFNATLFAPAGQPLIEAASLSQLSSNLGKEDLEWIGVQIPVSSLSMAQQTFLKTDITPLTVAAAPSPNANGMGNAGAGPYNTNGAETAQVPLAPASAGNSGIGNQFTFTEFGYGVSGSTPGAEAGAFNTKYGAGFSTNLVYTTKLGAGNLLPYGTERYFGDTVNTFSTYTGGPYKYYAESWEMAGGQQANSGDSGAPLIDTQSGSSAQGDIQGVLTNVWGDNAGNLYFAGGYEGFTNTSEGLGDAFTATDVATINADDAAYCTPEPKEIVALLGLAGGALIFWIKPRRKSLPCADTSAV